MTDVSSILASLPPLPWSVDPNVCGRAIDANEEGVFVAEPDVTRAIVALVNASPSLLRDSEAMRAAITNAAGDAPRPSAPSLDFPATQSFRFAEEVAPYLPQGARMPPLPTFGIALKLWIKAETERLRDPEAWAAKQALEAKRDALAKEQREAAERREAMEQRQAWLDRAVERGCFAHKPTMDAIVKPRDTHAIRAVRVAMKWRDEHSDGRATHGAVLVLSGSNGVGKTVAASWMIASIGGSVDDALFVRAATIGSLPTSDYSEYIKAKKRYVDAMFLAIDECGDEMAKQAGGRVSALIRERYDAGRFTVLTTNLPEAAFAARYFCAKDASGALIVDERIKSRILDEQTKAGLRAWVDLPAENLRGRA